MVHEAFSLVNFHSIIISDVLQWTFVSIHLVIVSVVNVTGVCLSSSSDGIIDTWRDKLINGVIETKSLFIMRHVPDKGPEPPRHSWRRWARGSCWWWLPRWPGSGGGSPPGRAPGRGTLREAGSLSLEYWGPAPGWSWCHWNEENCWADWLKFLKRILEMFCGLFYLLLDV